ncbi:MAG: flagellar motor protein MotB [Lachnospiraceae bacterium]
MARKKEEEAKSGGAPGWMATFSDLMNLLLCFFVLLFSMSSVDAQKFEMVIASLQSSFSILPSGGASIGEGQMVSSGVSQLKELDVYYNQAMNSDGDGEGSKEDGKGEGNYVEEYKKAGLDESEKMAAEIEKKLQENGIKDQVEVDFNEQYVLLTLNGAILFESGKAEVYKEAVPLIKKIANIIEKYNKNIIDIEGHTDNVPIHNSEYANNDELSTFRALAVTEYIRDNTELDNRYIKFSGRGSYVPIADNTSKRGRAKNRRVEIKIYNSYNSDN